MANLEIEIGASISGLESALRNASDKLGSFGKKATAAGKTLSLTVSAPLLALGGFAVKAASDLEESGSKFRTVFRDIGDEAENAFQTLRKEYGLSSNASLELLGSTGDLLTGFGFGQKAALDLSEEVNKLAVDLASFTNFSGGAKGASEALTKALLGERESVKSLGISILEEDVKRQVALNTAKGMTFETERQAKAYATLDLAIQQSGNAIGDYARTQDSFANQFRLLQTRIGDLAAEFGKVLLPLATKLASFIGKLVLKFSELSSTAKTVIVVVAGVAAAIGPLLLAVGGVISALPILASAIGAVKVALVAFTGPIGLAVAAVAAITAGVIAFRNGWRPFKMLIEDTKKPIIDFSEATKIAKDAQELLNKAVGVSIKDNPKLISSIQSQALAKIESVKATLAQINAQRLANVAIEEEITLADKLLFILNGGLTPAQRANERQTEKNAKINKDFATKSEALQNELNTLTLSIITLGTGSSKTGEEVEMLGDGFSKIEEKAVSAGNAIKRAFSTAISGAGEREPGQFASLDTSGAGLSIPPINEESKSAFLESLDRFNQQATDILTNGVSNVIGDFAFSIGEALGAGANVVDTIGATLLKGIAQIANQLGQAAIGIGISMLAIKKSFSNPATAIAAGVALVALAGVISSQVPKIVSGAGGGAGASGVGGGQSFSGSGTNTALADSIGGLEITGTSKIEGQDIIISYEKAQRVNNR